VTQTEQPDPVASLPAKRPTSREDLRPSGLESPIAGISDELRAIAANGLHFSQDPYDLERYRRLRDLAATLLGLIDSRSTVELTRIFHEDVEVHTPAVLVDGAVFDAEGRLLLAQRADSGLWCIPGGASDVGESPSAGAVREVKEETGLEVRANRVIGVFDNRSFGLPSVARHAYYLVFECEVLGGELTPSIETTDFRWVTEEEAMALPLFRTHLKKVPAAFLARRHPDAPIAFH
jgi:8-oxo-dGTP pyrophosphatase MutT (NUDIX family)